MSHVRHRADDATIDLTLDRAEGFYPAAVVEQALADHSRTNVQPRRRDRALYDTFGFSRLGVHESGVDQQAAVLAAIFEPDQLVTLMEALEEIEAQDPERTRSLTEALLAAHDLGDR